MKTNGLRLMIYRFILLVLLSLYFTLVFGQGNESGTAFKQTDFALTGQSTPKLLNFDGMLVEKQVKLNWKFETTAGLEECILERADSSNEFKPVAYFFMTEDINIPSLKFSDKVPGSKTYFYRLRITGKDGNTDYSKVITVKNSNDLKKL